MDPANIMNQFHGIQLPEVTDADAEKVLAELGIGPAAKE